MTRTTLLTAVAAGLALALLHQFPAGLRVILILVVLLLIYFIPTRLGWKQTRPQISL